MAQSGFRAGFIIKNDGDTLNGLVFYGSNGKFKKACLFKRFEIAQEFSYSSSEIKAYGFANGRYFESKTIGKKRTFLECLVQGVVSVYIIPGDYRGSVYLQSSSTGLFKLEKGNNNIKGEDFGSYRDVLAWMLNTQGDLKVSLSYLDYDAKEIAIAVRKSFSFSGIASKGFCQTPGVNNLQDNSFLKDGSLLSIGLCGGYQFLSINTPASADLQYFAQAQFNKSFRPVIGLFLNTRFSKVSDRWSVDLALQYLADSYYGYSEYPIHESETNRDDIMIDFSEMQFPLALRFTFGKGNTRTYVKAGGYMSFIIDQAYSRQSETQIEDSDYLLDGGSVFTDYYEDFELHNVSGFIAGAGIQFKLGKARLLNIEGLYSRGSQVLSNPDSDEKTDLITSGISIMARINL